MKKNTRFNGFLVALFFCFSTQIFAQVGVGTTTPRGALDISSSDQGFIPPQVALTALNVAAPVVNPQGGALTPGTTVWNTNTAGAIPNNVSPGMYYWDGTRWVSLAGSPGGLDWSITGNGGIDGGVTGVTGVTATQGTHFIGTYDVTNFDIRTSGLHAARVSSLGEFFIGALETVLPGDLMNGVSEGNAIFPWAINGYTDQDGAGVYGSVTGGNTFFAAVQGEYVGDGARGAGVRGTNFNTTTNGTLFHQPKTGVIGSLASPGHSNTNAFGVYGNSSNNSGRAVGGILGVNYSNGTYGMIGYERSNGNNVSILASNGTTNGGFRTSGSTSNSTIGLGVDGGFLGGHIKGNQIGLISKGKIAGHYSDGASLSTKGFAVIKRDNLGNKRPTYVPVSTSIDVSTKGMGKLENGEAYISFDENYTKLVEDNKPIIVTVSPTGESNGVYVSKVDKHGFYVKENNNGNNNVKFYWIAIGEQINSDELIINNDFLRNEFDSNLENFMTIDESNSNSKAMWWNGDKLQFGNDAPTNPNEKSLENNQEKTQRYKHSIRTPKKENLRASQLKKLQKN